jgi:hypothetical protein
MDDVIDIQDRRLMAMQNAEDTTTDYRATGGAIFDALDCGVDPFAVREAFFTSATAQDFELALWKLRGLGGCLTRSD